MSIPHNIRYLARDAYRQAMYSGRYESTRGNYRTDVRAVTGFVIITKYRGEQQGEWSVPIAKSWL